MDAPLTYVDLPRAVLKISGADRISFLQGIVTNDVKKLSPQHPLYACMLTPQGKFLYDFFLMADGESIVMDCRTEDVAAIQKKLMMYKLRSQVGIEPQPQMQVRVILHATMPNSMQADGFTVQDPRTPGLAARLIGTENFIQAHTPTGAIMGCADDYLAARIHAGVPEGGVELLSEDGFPLHYRLDDFHAIDFTKGCYVGQEVTARMKHRDAIRKTLVKIQAEQPFTALDDITQEGTSIGRLRSFHGRQGLAIVNAEAAQNSPRAMVGNIPVILLIHA